MRQRKFHQILTAILTFLAYVSFHATRKAFSAAKVPIQNQWHWSSQFLGVMDFLFLSFYAVGLYISGYLGDKFDLKRVLLCGMFLTAVCTTLVGCGQIFGIQRTEWVFGVFWGLNGLVQSAGWPTTVGIMGNWFDRNTSGRVFGVWSANASVGNIVGNSLVGLCTHYNWPIIFMFLLPSGVVLVVGACCACMLVNEPEQLGFTAADTVKTPADETAPLYAVATDTTTTTFSAADINDEDGGGGVLPSLSVLEALLIPGVITYALSYACIKMVNYSLFFWLPYYLTRSLHYTASNGDTLSSLYDVGQIFGGSVAGYVSDRMGVRSPIVVLFIVLAIASLNMFTLAETKVHVDLLLVSTGFLLGGPANLISSTISADLGKHESISGNAKALSTVTGIIDGTGSVGAAIGQLFVSYLSHKYSWHAVFYFLMIMTCLGGVCIGKLFVADMKLVCGGGGSGRNRNRSHASSSSPSSPRHTHYTIVHQSSSSFAGAGAAPDTSHDHSSARF